MKLAILPFKRPPQRLPNPPPTMTLFRMWTLPLTFSVRPRPSKPEETLSTMVRCVRVTLPAMSSAPPPYFARFPLKLLFIMLALSLKPSIAPPLIREVLLMKLLLLMVDVP